MNSRFVIYPLIVFTIGTALLIPYLNDDPPPDPNVGKRATQQVLLHECVSRTKERLHDPKTAEIPDPIFNSSQYSITDDSKGRTSVQFEIRARNAFNALRANLVTCSFEPTKDGGFTVVRHDIKQQ